MGGYNYTSGNPYYRYQYNGKELQDDTGMLDYGWRQYMPELGRWNGMDQLSEAYSSSSPYAYVMNNPVMKYDPDGRITKEWLNGIYNMSPSGRTTYSQFSSNGTTAWATNDPLMYGTTNIILNFIRGDKEGLGNFLNSDFEANGWHIIDATGLKSALTKLNAYLGGNKADNIFINAHGSVSERYVYDENGELIPDSSKNGRYGYKVIGDNGFYTANDNILGSDIQQYITDKSKLSSDKLSSINDLISITNYVKEGKNLIIGTCWSARYDDNLGIGISSIVKSRDVFVNRDYSSAWPVGGIVRFQDFINFKQTSQRNYINGWVWYRDGVATQRNFNIIMTKYGVKIIK